MRLRLPVFIRKPKHVYLVMESDWGCDGRDVWRQYPVCAFLTARGAARNVAGRRMPHLFKVKKVPLSPRSEERR